MNTTQAKNTAMLMGVLSLCVLGACSDPYRRPLHAADSPRVNGVVVVPPHHTTRRVCSTCGVVRSITAVNGGGGNSGVGAVIGAIIGGIAGHQIGGGTGRDVATVAGAIGGAVAGGKVESERNGDKVYEVRIEMEDGTERIITVADASALHSGMEVNVRGNEISF